MKNSKMYLLLPVRSILFLLVFITGSLLVHKSLDEISRWWSVVASAANILTILLLIIVAKKNGMTYFELINFDRKKIHAGKTILIMIISAVIGMGGMYLSGLILYGSFMPEVSLKMIAPVPKAFAAVNLVLLPVSTALAEDGLYLGAGVGRIKNKYIAVIIPAFFFALQHCFIPTLFDARYMAYRFISFLPATLAFSIYYYKKREPLPIMAGHALLDLATAISIFINSAFPDLFSSML